MTAIEVRDFRFPIDEAPRDWHPAGRAVTAYWDELSIFFPRGEAFFVKSVRKFNTPVFPNSAGVLDVNGYAQAGCQTWLTNLGPMIGSRDDFSAIIVLPGNAVPSNGAGFDVMP